MRILKSSGELKVTVSSVLPFWGVIAISATLCFIGREGRTEEMHKLVDLKGRVMEARVEEVKDGQVSIKRLDGKRFVLPVSKFEFLTQHFLLNWTDREILERTKRACLHAVNVKEQLHGTANKEVIKFKNSAGKALINANHIEEAIAYLSKASKRQGESGASWHVFRTKHLLGYAMLLSEMTPAAEALFIEGAEGMVRAQSSLNHPESANLIMSHVALRINRYLEVTKSDESSSKKWKGLYEKYRKTLDKFEPLTIDLHRMRSRETPHFNIVSPFSSVGDYARIAEEAWDELVNIFPALRADFEKGDFMTPYGLRAPITQYGEDGRFRFLLVLPDKQAMEPIMKRYLESIDDAKHRDAAFSLASVYGFIEDKDNRFLVARIRDPKRYSDPNQNWTFNRVVHNLPEALFKLTLRSGDQAYWLHTGLGYHLEHKLTGVASVHYSGKDFNREGFRRNTSWHDAMRKIAENGGEPNMKRIIWGGDRRAEDYGYMWAIIEMLLADPERAVLLGDFVLQSRQTPSYMNEKEVALWFNYADPKEMSMAVKVFIRSKSFK